MWKGKKEKKRGGERKNQEEEWWQNLILKGGKNNFEKGKGNAGVYIYYILTSNDPPPKKKRKLLRGYNANYIMTWKKRGKSTFLLYVKWLKYLMQVQKGIINCKLAGSGVWALATKSVLCRFKSINSDHLFLWMPHMVKIFDNYILCIFCIFCHTEVYNSIINLFLFQYLI